MRSRTIALLTAVMAVGIVCALTLSPNIKVDAKSNGQQLAEANERQPEISDIKFKELGGNEQTELLLEGLKNYTAAGSLNVESFGNTPEKAKAAADQANKFTVFVMSGDFVAQKAKDDDKDFSYILKKIGDQHSIALVVGGETGAIVKGMQQAGVAEEGSGNSLEDNPPIAGYRVFVNEHGDNVVEEHGFGGSVEDEAIHKVIAGWLESNAE